ncbi:MAG TPA: insulinase family protein, partial [Acidobacteriota bacterium]|nr:insulinase family protein [Acidobacteriota bacterium]
MPPVHRHQLPNGLTVLVIVDHRLPVVCSTIWYRVGTRDEPKNQTGIAHFLEHMMFKGTARFPKGRIDAISLQRGGNNNAFTSYDCTGYYFTFAADRWDV